MGGGVGVSAHANTRVVTDTSKIAMPEVGIGFIPDVGGAYLLSRAPGALGLHAALTGAPFSGADAIAMGFADHYVPHGDLDAFTAAIATDGIARALAHHAIEPPPSELAAQRDWIDKCYCQATPSIDIVAALRGHDAGPAQDAAEPDRHPLPHRGVGGVEGGAPRRQAGNAGRCSGAGLSGVVAHRRVHTTWWRASARRSSTKIAIRSGHRRHWPQVSAADVDAYFAPVDDDLSF